LSLLPPLLGYLRQLRKVPCFLSSCPASTVLKRCVRREYYFIHAHAADDQREECFDHWTVFGSPNQVYSVYTFATRAGILTCCWAHHHQLRSSAYPFSSSSPTCIISDQENPSMTTYHPPLWR
jgi:hypothetical protein